MSLIFFVLFLVYALVLSVISGILIALTSGLGQARLLLQILAILALIAGFAYPAVRLSLAPAMTFADGRITLFRSLPLTKQQFWSMAGAYVLGIVLTVVVFLLGAVVFTFVSGALAMAEGGLGALPVALGAMQPADIDAQRVPVPRSHPKPGVRGPSGDPRLCDPVRPWGSHLP